MFRKSTFLLLAVALSIGVANAENTLDVKRERERAVSLMKHGRYAEARHSLTLLREQAPIDDEVLVRDIDFELARCAFELRDSDAEKVLLAYLRRYPESVHVNEVRFMLAMHYSERNEQTKAREYLGVVSYNALSTEDRERYNMRMGYIEFSAGEYDKAYKYFSLLSPIGKYADHAIYYKSYMHYARGEYNEAYNGFASLTNSSNYSKVIPYYLFQIEFARGNYNYIITHGDKLLAQSVEAERTALMRVIAEAWYRLKGYSKAFVYISMYKISGGEMERDENYILGYSAYRSADFATATEALLKVIEGHSDELAQNASYHLADCYMRRGNKRQAIHAFAMAADKKYKNNIAEDALFNYGKLLFETGSGTFNEPINVLTRYLAEYPDSERYEEAQELLIAAYYNSHDYDMAYKAIKAFPNPNVTLRTALQKIAYFNGLESFSAGDYEVAKAKLEEAQKVGVSPKYNALCWLWLGEIAYKQGDYVLAAKNYDSYIRRAPKTEHEYKMALYNLGYAYFSQQSMEKSQKAFSDFVSNYGKKDQYLADAYNRLGDTHYSQRKYANAVKSYDNAILLSSALGTTEQHYAKYQRAIALGLQGKTDAKIKALTQMQKENCGDYNDDAAYELGRTYVSLSHYSDSASVLENFVEKYPQSPYYIPALLDLGLVYLNLGDSDKSLHFYDKIITSMPQSAAAKDAMQSVREIYVNRGAISEYFAYAERTGVECDLSAMARDSLSFRSAQNIYLSERKTEAIPHFKKYLADYPKGYYTNDVLYYLSDCYIKIDSLDSAISSLKLLAEQPRNQYTVPVVETLARITFNKAMYEDAAVAYRRLYDVVDSAAKRTEAANGYAESTMLRKDGDALLAMADDLDTLADVNVVTLRKVRFAKANVLASRDEVAEARKIYEKLSADMTTAEGAESAYRIIEALFNEGRLDECEERVYALADSKTSHTYWLGKAFITLGDVYVQRNNTFQASATYRSVVDGYSPADDGIVAEAQSKLEKLN